MRASWNILTDLSLDSLEVLCNCVLLKNPIVIGTEEGEKTRGPCGGISLITVTEYLTTWNECPMKHVKKKNNECHVELVTSRQHACWTPSPGKQHPVNGGFVFDARMQAHVPHYMSQRSPNVSCDFAILANPIVIEFKEGGRQEVHVGEYRSQKKHYRTTSSQ